MNELLEFAVWSGGLFSVVCGLMYVLTVIDPRTERAAAVSATALGAARVGQKR